MVADPDVPAAAVAVALLLFRSGCSRIRGGGGDSECVMIANGARRLELRVNNEVRTRF